MAKYSNTPADRFNKSGQDSKEELSVGAKTIRDQRLHAGQAADIGRSPPSRIYTRDYCKTGPEKGDTDLIFPVLGNPLRW